jgi:hypothetical protein
MSKLNQNLNTVNPPEADEDNSSIHTVRHARDFVQVANCTAQDSRLSWEARGLLLYLLSLPKDWNIRVSHLQKQGGAGRDAVRRILHELQQFGYASGVGKENQERGERGRFGRQMGIQVYESPALNPLHSEEKSPSPENPSTVASPVTDSPQTARPSPENPSTVASPVTDSPQTARPSPENPSAYKEEGLQKTELQKTHTKQTDLRAVGAPTVAVRVGSRFTIEECRRYAKHLQSTGQGINNPGGYATTIHRTGDVDAQIEEFLSRTPEQIEDMRTAPENSNLFFGEAVQMLQAMIAVGRDPQATIDDMPLDDDTRRRLIEKFVKTQAHESKAPDNLRNTPGPELKQASVSALNQAAS